jgi:hypothetical protein
VFVHADDHHRRLRRGLRHHRQPRDPGGAEHRLVQHHHIRRDTTEETDEIRQVRGRTCRFDALFALEQSPERCPDPLVAGRDEHRHGRALDRSRLYGHADKNRREAASTHPRASLNRHP